MPLAVSEIHDVVADERLVIIALEKESGILFESRLSVLGLLNSIIHLPFFKRTLCLAPNKIEIVTDLREAKYDVSKILKALVATSLCDQLFSELSDSALWYEDADEITRGLWEDYGINEGSTLNDVRGLLHRLLKRKSKAGVSAAVEICLGEYIPRDSRAYPGALHNVQCFELPSERLLELLVMRRILEEAEK